MFGVGYLRAKSEEALSTGKGGLSCLTLLVGFLVHLGCLELELGLCLGWVEISMVYQDHSSQQGRWEWEENVPDAFWSQAQILFQNPLKPMTELILEPGSAVILE